MIILAVHIVLTVFYGTRKEGFHEDEYYSYFTSAGNARLYPYDSNLWELRGYDVQRQFLVTDGHRFDFGTVSSIQELDVHPPLYYLSLNFVMSLFVNQFRKWFGIGLNAVYSLVTCCGVIFFFYHVDKSNRRHSLALIAGLAYAICPAMISNVLFARMYAMSAMWTVLYADVFAVLLNHLQCSRRRFAGITFCACLLCYLSFLTHYFCLFMAFFLTLGYCVYTLCKRQGIMRMLIYGAAQVIAIGLAVLTYPASLVHIFGGYRGEDAFSGLLETAPFERLRTFFPLLNHNFFAGMLIPVLLILVLAAVIDILLITYRRKNGTDGQALSANRITIIITLAAGGLSVALLSRTSLVIGDSSSRYFYPVAAILLPCMAYCICKTGLALQACCCMRRAGKKDNAGKNRDSVLCRLPILILAAWISIPSVAGFLQGNVLFLYSGKGANVQFSQENAAYPVVVVYNGEARYRSWFMANELWPFEHVVYVDMREEDSISDSQILKTAEKLIVYLVGSEDILKKMIAQNVNLDSYTQIRVDELFVVYVLE